MTYRVEISRYHESCMAPYETKTREFETKKHILAYVRGYASEAVIFRTNRVLVRWPSDERCTIDIWEKK